VFLILLALARHEPALEPLPLPLQEATGRLATEMATSLRALAQHLRSGGSTPTRSLEDASTAADRWLSSHTAPEGTENDPVRGLAVLYRELVIAVTRLTAVAADGLTRHRGGNGESRRTAS